MRLVEIKEGKARIFIPDPKEYEKNGKFDPSWAPVFYNPRMMFNRDISVIAVSIISPKSIIDALAASGIRGIRYYLESNSPIEEIIFNDKSKVAVDLISKNVEANGVKVAKITNRDANSLLYEVITDYVDIDPFGSPSPFILSSVNAVKNGGYIAYTATDLAPLEGSAKKSCKRKYDVNNSKLSFSKEVGLRVLISKIVREAAIVEKAVEPIFAFYNDYYYRVIIRVTRGAKRADESIEKLGYFYECEKCGSSGSSKDPIEKCPRCGNKVKISGPVWLGKINDDSFVHKMIDYLQNFSYIKNFETVSILLHKILQENKYPPGYYNLEFIASKYKINVPAREKIIECLGDASQTHFSSKGIKTSKSFDEILECMKTLSNKV
ncbi:MAG: tRNA (guanine(26)-N(2))-dimethyltransferase [Acidianus sp.]|jgi:tRNA (guanine26-N2/guanine27-N2)-dimethyltransferase|nr:tRNA (guanine(26)-N(2))-dimethyltransferase [Acidianus sp.]